MDPNLCDDAGCAGCSRVSVESLDENPKMLVTYLGEYAVVTDEVPELKVPGCLACFLLGLIKLDQYMTAVVYLGSDSASLNESIVSVGDEDFYRYWVRHNDPDNIEEAHRMVVQSFKSGLIDASTPRGVEYIAERDANLVRLRSEASKRLDQIGDIF
jgi:hypothetical protein